MSRLLISCCLLLALSGCNNATMSPKKPSATGLPAEDVPVTAAGDSADGSTDRGPVAPASGEDDDETPGKAVVSNKASRKSVDEDDGGENDVTGEKKSDDPKSEAKEAAFAAAKRAANKRDLPGAIKALENGLKEIPDDLDFLMNLSQLYAATAEDEGGKSDPSKIRKAAEYLRTALKAHPKLKSDRDFKRFGQQLLYRDAVALALTKQPAKALEVLGEATELGFNSYARIEKDDDLESVRALPEFADFITQAKKREIDDAFAMEAFDFNFELTDIEGNAIAKADFKGKVLIVDVWGTWCPPCRMEIPHFVELAKKYGEAGLVIVGLNSEGGTDAKTVKKVKEFHEENGMNYRCALVEQETIEQIPNMEGFPTTLFFDRAGKVRVKAVGYHEFETLEAFVTRLLEEKPEADAGT